MRAGTFAGLLTLAAVGCGDAAPGNETKNVSQGGAAATGGASSQAGATGGSASTGGSAASGGGNTTLCPEGGRLLAEPLACDGPTVDPPAALLVDAAVSPPGTILDLAGVDGNDVPCLPVAVCRPSEAPTLVFSDEPETVFDDGVLYAEFLEPGQRYRVYTYHVNGTGSLRKFPVVVLNQGDVGATVTITARGLAGPTTNYLEAGREAALAWIQGAAPQAVEVPPQTRVLLDADLDARHAATDELVHALYDLEVDAPVKLSVVSVGASADAATVTAGLSVVPSAGLHVRGTFPGADLDLILAEPASADLRHVRLGANLIDPDLTGTSLVDGGERVTLKGNFGLRYRLVGLSDTSVAINPRAGVWAGAARLGAGGFLVPSGDLAVSDNATAALIGETLPGTLVLLTAGGSNLPIHLLTWRP